MDKYIKTKIEKDIDKCVNIYGIEGLEDKIYTIYAGCPSIREKYLDLFYKKYSFLKKY